MESARTSEEPKPVDADDPERSSVDGMNVFDGNEAGWVCVGASAGREGQFQMPPQGARAWPGREGR
jgi:hypothetical protein